MKIEKKCWPEYFEEILSGRKNFDFRLADWECNPGDILVLCEWDPEKKDYTGRQIEKEIAYVLKSKDIICFSKEDIKKYGFQIISFK